MKIVKGGRKFFGVNNFENLTASECEFRSASFGGNGRWKDRVIDRAHNIVLRDCRVKGCFVGPGVIEKAHISNIDGDLVIAWGTLFSEVKLSGDIFGLMLHGIPSPRANDLDVSNYETIINNFYKSAEWGLDISEARFGDLSIRTNAIPLNKVKLDLNTQFPLNKNRFSDCDVGKLNIGDISKSVINCMLSDGADEALLVAPLLDPRCYELVLRDVDELKRIGLVE